MNRTILKEKQTFFTKCMVCMIFTFQTHHHHHRCLWTHSYYYLTLIVFLCSCDGVYFGLVFEQHGRPIASMHQLGQNTLEVVPLVKILVKFSTRLTPRAARVSLFTRLSIENDLSSFAVLTGKQNADSATKRIFLNSILHFSELKIRCQVRKQFVLEQFKKAIV